MSVPYRRFEILLPLRFNDGQRVPNDLLADTFLELRNQFGAVSTETQSIHGQWSHEREVYRDELIRVFLDVEDTTENRQFFVGFKKELKQHYQQIDIWITSHPVDVL